ncbi:hypothetical protein BGX28_005133, partial [Mortierella sp. GBA30]
AFSAAQHDILATPSPLSAHAQKTFSAQSMLESNVRFLCDMVDNVLKTGTELEQKTKPLRIQIQSSESASNISIRGEQKSPLFLLTPRTFTEAKNDISKVDGGIVSKFNRDTLLNLFPTPPMALPKTKCAPVAFPRVSVSNPTKFLDPNRAVEALSPCHPLSPRGPLSPPKPLIARRNAVAESQPAAVSTPALVISAHPEPCQDMTPTLACSPISSLSLSPMDALSQHLWNIETQMRRPSFLMNRRTSSLSALFVSNAESPVVEKQQERLLAELSLTVGTIASPKENVPVILSEPCGESEQDVDWRAWHGTYRRRRMNSEDEAPLSPTRSASRASCSSSASERSNSNSLYATAPSTPICHRPTTPSTPKSRKPRIFHSSFSFSSSSLSLSSTSTASSSASSSNLSSPPKNANPEMSGGETQKWGDRLQSLVHNLQSSAGKHSRRLVNNILPKSRWPRRSRSRTSSEESKGCSFKKSFL